MRNDQSYFCNTWSRSYYYAKRQYQLWKRGRSIQLGYPGNMEVIYDTLRLRHSTNKLVSNVVSSSTSFFWYGGWSLYICNGRPWHTIELYRLFYACIDALERKILRIWSGPLIDNHKPAVYACPSCPGGLIGRRHCSSRLPSLRMEGGVVCVSTHLNYYQWLIFP